MKKIRTNKTILLILLIAFPTTVIFSNLIVNARADIPNPHQDNEWHWGIQADDKIYYETEMVMTNMSSPTPEIIIASRILQILNITSIDNRTQDFMGEDDFSEVNVTQLYYDYEDEELKAPPGTVPGPMAIFCFNESHMFRERYFTTSLIPFVIPINGSWDNEVEVMDDILNNTLYNTYYTMGMMNRFNSYGADSLTNTMWFLNTTDGYYMDFTYNSTDGVLEYCNTSFLIYSMGEEMLYEIIARRVFDIDITDDLTWGVNVGETFYFDQSSESFMMDYQEVKVVISGFNESVYEVPTGMYGGYMNMTFQNILANISIWDGTQHVPTYTNYTIGSANNLYAMNMNIVQDMYFSVIPTSHTLNDVEFFIEYMALAIPGFPFDEKGVFEKDGYLCIELNVSTTDDFVQTKYNSTNGVLETWLQIVSGEVQIASFRKDIPQPWLWSVDVGDVMYVKKINTLSEAEGDIRARIAYFWGGFTNLTFVLEYVGIPSLPGDPEFQFFYFVYAYLDEWNETSGTWSTSMSPEIFAIANDLWPLFPTFFPNHLIPLGTTGFDCQRYINALTPFYDDISVSSDAIICTNTTESKSASIYLDSIKGTVPYHGGWIPDYQFGSGWIHFSGYLKYNETIGSGLNIIPIQSDLITDITFTVNIIGGSGAEYLYSYLSENPVNESLPIGTPLYFVDQLLINSYLITENITAIIAFPLSIDLSEIELHFYGWNISGTSVWEEATPEYYDTIIYDYINNRVITVYPSWGNNSMISAGSVEFLPPGSFTLDSNADSPDDDGNFTLSWDPSDRANNYSVYESSSLIDESNIGSATLLAAEIEDNSYPRTDYVNGTYFFIVEAHNDYGDTLSNCYQVVVAIPSEEEDEPPGSFTLSSNAGTPDDDGSFTLSWTAADGATSYTIYEYSSLITEINGSLTILAEDVTSRTLSLSDYTDGTYYFIVVASNNIGTTLSNCHKVDVEIEGGGGGPPIPGYNIYFILILSFAAIVIIVRKKRGKLP